MGSIPIHSRQRSRRFAFCVVAACLWLFGASAQAQKPDTTRVRTDTARARTDTSRAHADTARRRRAAATPAIPDSLKPPLSPRRAFLYSAIIPGYSQSKLGRNKAAAVMLTVEAIAIAMIRESETDVREARSMSGDSVVVSYVDATGVALTNPVPAFPRRFDVPYVHVRQSHVEDWVAFLIANHLFSGADAFVAANLWDVPAQLQIRAMPGGASIGAKLTW
ncbi:MAG TPA: hypothetical protein VGH98_04310 [Gemmatimonadaceae bacterium]